MYTQEFRVSDERLPALLQIADFLLIEPLVEDIIAHLKKILSKQNCLTIWRACQAEKLPLRLIEEIFKCLIVNHEDVLGGSELTPADEQELIFAMESYIIVFLDSERNLRQFGFLVSVLEFIVGHCHEQQKQEILDKMAPSFDGMWWEFALEDREQEFTSSIIPCLERLLSPENAIEMWLTCWRHWRNDYVENQELEDFLHLCEEFIAVNYQRIPMSQEMRKRHETYNSRLLHLVPEVHRQEMVALYNQKEGQENLTGGAMPKDDPSSFFIYDDL